MGAILNIEITKENVWDKASADTVGLKKYFEQHRNAYAYSERAEVTTYTLSGTSLKEGKKLAKKFKKMNTDEIKSAFPNIPQDEKVIDKDDEKASQVVWKAGKLSALTPLGNSGTAFTLMQTNKIVPAKNKELKECRGYVCFM